VATEACPSVACTRWMGAPRSRLCEAWACRSQCAETSPGSPALAAAAFTTRWTALGSSAPPFRDRKTGASADAGASLASASGMSPTWRLASARRAASTFHVEAESRTARVLPPLPNTVACPAEAGAKPAAGQTRLAVLKSALTFCIVAGHRSCRTLRDDIRELRLPVPRPRSMYATVDQVRNAIAAAHAMGRPSLALCYAVQFETALRQWDAAGRWYPLADPTICPVVYGQHKWAGLEWRHVGEDLVLSYTPSKTRASSGAEVVIDLQLCPMVLEEMARIPGDARSGPLIVNEATELPFTDQQFLSAWKRVREAAGLPPELWSRDLRASAITEGRGAGAFTDDAAKVAGHTKPRTTADVYDRERLEAHRRFATARLGRRAPKSEG
jgi:hypothetical protein